jgi:hypothetical protein
LLNLRCSADASNPNPHDWQTLRCVISSIHRVQIRPKLVPADARQRLDLQHAKRRAHFPLRYCWPADAEKRGQSRIAAC